MHRVVCVIVYRHVRLILNRVHSIHFIRESSQKLRDSEINSIHGTTTWVFARKGHVASQRAMFAMFANLAAKMKGQGLGALRDKKLR